MNFIDIVFWIWVIVTALSFLWFYSNETWGCFFDRLCSGFLGAIFTGFVSACILILTTFGVDHFFAKEIVTQRTASRTIYSLDLTTRTSGSFVLGSGSISGKEVYSFFLRDENGAFFKEYSDASTRLIERDSVPSVTWHIERTSSPKWFTDYCSEETIKTEIIIPRGTIISKFEVQ